MKLCGPGSANCGFKFSLNQLQQRHFLESQKKVADASGFSMNAAKKKRCPNDDVLERP